MHARCVGWARVWVWGENYLGTSPAVWEHRYLCCESGAGVWSEGSLGFRVMVKNFSSISLRLGHNVLDWTALLGIFSLIFETFLGGALRHNVYRGYIVFWGTIIYCSLACGSPGIRRNKGKEGNKGRMPLLDWAADHNSSRTPGLKQRLVS